MEILEEVSALFESLCLDVEDIRLSLARGMIFPEEHGGVHCLEQVLAFIEQGDYPPSWASESEADQKKYKKTFDFCKAAFIKAVVEVAGEEKNTDVMWDDSEEESPGGPYVSKMVDWIRRGANEDANHFRDDLVICASISLGNLVRRGMCLDASFTSSETTPSVVNRGTFSCHCQTSYLPDYSAGLTAGP